MMRLTSGSLSNKAFFKIRTTDTATSSVAGVIDQSININDPSAAQDFSNVATLYDSYKVNFIKVQWIPLYDFTASSTVVNNYGIFLHDFDSTASTIGSNAIAIQYENAKFFDMKRRFTYFVRYVPRITGSEAGTNSTIYQGGYMDLADGINVGKIFLYAENLTASSSYGRLIITWYITAKNRR